MTHMGNTTSTLVSSHWKQPWSGSPGQRARSSCRQQESGMWNGEHSPVQATGSTAGRGAGKPAQMSPACKPSMNVPLVDPPHVSLWAATGADEAEFPPLVVETHFRSYWLFSLRLNEIRMGLRERGKPAEQIEMEGEAE